MTSRFRTSDLTLATVLKLNGCEATLERKDSDDGKIVGAWSFQLSDELHEAIMRFNEGSKDGYVEPREFHRMLARTKDELFHFINKEKKGKR